MICIAIVLADVMTPIRICNDNFAVDAFRANYHLTTSVCQLIEKRSPDFELLFFLKFRVHVRIRSDSPSCHIDVYVLWDRYGSFQSKS